MEKRIFLWIVLIVMVLSSSMTVFAQPQQDYFEDGNQQILILVGPQYGTPIGNTITSVMVDTFLSAGVSLDDIFVEFLDIHRIPGDQHRSNLLISLQNKLTDKNIGLIIAVNQGAVDFVAQEGHNLFPDAPMLIPIFEKKPDWAGEPRRLITLTSLQDAEGTLRHALSLFPRTQRVVIIMGKDDSRAPFYDVVHKAVDELPDKLEIEDTSNLTYEEMLQYVSSLPGDTIALYGSYFEDISGRSFIPAEVAAQVAVTANVPVFAFRDIHIYMGLVGGSIIHTTKLGNQAAETGLDYLNGKIQLSQQTSNIEVSNVTLFDWQQLNQWGADPGVLPEETIFFNYTPTLWESHRELILVISLFIVVLLFLVVLLFITNRKQKITLDRLHESEYELLKNKEYLNNLIRYANAPIITWSPDFKITEFNQAFETLTGRTREEVLGQHLEILFPDDSRLESMNHISRTVAGEFWEAIDIPIKHISGKVHSVLWNSANIKNPEGKLIATIAQGQDITERKQAENESRKQAHLAKVLLRVTSNLNAELELDKVTRIICEEACVAFHVHTSLYLDYDSNTRLFHVAASSGLPEEVARTLEPLSRDDIDILLNKQDKTSVIPDLSAVPEMPFVQTLLSHGIQSNAYALVERDGLTLGILVVGDDDKADLSEDSITLLSGLANHTASAVTNARLFSEAKNRLNQVQALRNIDLAITGSLDLRVTFQVVLDEVTKMLQTDAAAIMRLDPHTGILKYEHWRGFRRKDIDKIIIPLGKGNVGRVALDRKSVHIHDLRESEHDLSHVALLTGEDFVAYYAVPLIAKGTVLGVLEVFHRERIVSNGEWLAFLETLAGQAAIAVDNAELFAKLERSNVDLLRAYDATIEGWAHALDLKDEETQDHSQRVTELTLRIAGKMGIKEEELAHVRRGALLHDIGKMGVPDSILLKPGKLTDEEWEIMRKHPVYAFEMLSPIFYLRQGLDIPYCHHEKWDGSGYPRGLKGAQIPLAARVFAVVDVYDALTSDRPYRKAWTRKKTLEYIQEQSGKHFDPQVVDVFIKEIGDRIE